MIINPIKIAQRIQEPLKTGTMVELSNLRGDTLVVVLQNEYALEIKRLEPIAYGVDRFSVVYRAEAQNGIFLIKLKTGEFRPIAVTLPHYLQNQGINQVISAIQTKTGALWVEINGVILVLYPYIENRCAAEVDLSPGQWRDFGRTLKAIHRICLPPTLRKEVAQEELAAAYRQETLDILELVQRTTFSDPISWELADFILKEYQTILDLIHRTERLARIVQKASLPPVLCHSDIHEANLLVGLDGHIYLVDWDDPIFAPKERDLMYIGGGVLGKWKEPQQADWFYQGYGRVEINKNAQTYYRCERIITDIVVFSRHILKEEESVGERTMFLQYLRSNFDPGGTLDLALGT